MQVKGKFVGGCNDGPESWMGITKLIGNGELDKLLRAFTVGCKSIATACNDRTALQPTVAVSVSLVSVSCAAHDAGSVGTRTDKGVCCGRRSGAAART